MLSKSELELIHNLRSVSDDTKRDFWKLLCWLAANEHYELDDLSPTEFYDRVTAMIHAMPGT